MGEWFTPELVLALLGTSGVTSFITWLLSGKQRRAEVTHTNVESFTALADTLHKQIDAGQERFMGQVQQLRDMELGYRQQLAEEQRLNQQWEERYGAVREDRDRVVQQLHQMQLEKNARILELRHALQSLEAELAAYTWAIGQARAILEGRHPIELAAIDEGLEQMLRSPPSVH